MNWDVIGMLNSLDPHGGGFFHLLVDLLMWAAGPFIWLWAYIKYALKK